MLPFVPMTLIRMTHLALKTTIEGSCNSVRKRKDTDCRHVYSQLQGVRLLQRKPFWVHCLE